MSKETTINRLDLTVRHRTLQTRAGQGAPRNRHPDGPHSGPRNASKESSHIKLGLRKQWTKFEINNKNIS